METWVLLMTLTRSGETVPVRVPMNDYEQCMEGGHHAEDIAASLKGVKITWSCELSGRPGTG
jgi:hypothetical protein